MLMTRGKLTERARLRSDFILVGVDDRAGAGVRADDVGGELLAQIHLRLAIVRRVDLVLDRR